MSALFPGLSAPVAPAGIDLRCQDVREMLAGVRGATFLLADPPWIYDLKGVACDNMDQPSAGGAVLYPTMEVADIAEVARAAFDSAADDARLGVWCTFPKLGEWFAAFPGAPWRYVTGGAWGKLAGAHGSSGLGRHWRGRSEVLLIYVKGSPATHLNTELSNHHVSPTTGHSEKPVEWERLMLRRWTDPDDLVAELFSGFAPLARACLAEGRRYRGAEIDPERHARALVRLNEYRSLL